jgi:transposase
MKPSSLQHWYKNILSDYKQQIADKTIPSRQVEIQQIDKDTGKKTKSYPAYIFKPENIGEQMCIDDKAIAGEGYTILSNRKTNKIALLIESTRFNDLQIAFSKFTQTDLLKIKSISSDMDATYLKIGEELLPYATKVVDKYHVMKYVYDAVLNVLADEKKALSSKLSKGKSRTKKDTKILKKLSLLSRSRYRLLQSSDKWTDKAKEIMDEVFKISKNLETAYHLSQEFKRWYSGDDSRNIILKGDNLQKWYKTVSDFGSKNFNPVVKMIKKHEKYILNYFLELHTNANAEQLNQKINLFMANNFGIKNRKFFFFRLAKYFS